MRIITWNVNGLRAAIRKGIQEHLIALNPDIILFQEVRALPDQLPSKWANPDGWHTIWHPAQKKGYSGTAIWSRHTIQEKERGIGIEDVEGRVIHVSTADVEVVSVYLPSGSSGEDRQQIKENWMAQFRPWADTLVKKHTPVLMGGDFNIVHTAQDIFHAKSNENTSGYLPHEREWIGALIHSGWHDFLRESVGDIQGPYSWWSNRGKARELDRGWRIDYLLGNAATAKRFQSSHIHRDGGLTISDHAPVIVDLIS
jgi:exodeoxyribonuclease-3